MHRAVIWRIPGALLIALACAASKEPDSAPSPAVVRCEPVPSDSVSATVFLTLRPGGWQAEPLRRASQSELRILALALQTVQQAMASPERALTTAGTVSLYRGRAVPGTTQAPAHPATFTVETWDAWRRGRMVLEPALRIRAVLHPDGRLTEIEPTTPLSVMPGLDSALADALANVGEGHALAGLLGELRTFAGSPWHSDEARAPETDSLLLAFDAGVAPDTLFGSLPLLDVRLPVYDSAALPVTLPRNPVPTYPHGARFRGESGEVLVEFVVTPDGRVGRSTLRVLGATSRDFASAVEAVVPRYRFMPAEANGCMVPMRAQMPFGFRAPR